MATSSLTNTGNQPYTSARIDYLASYMQTQLPGLSHDAAVKWIRAEQGVHGNVLGVTYRDASGQHLYQYSSQEAGVRAAVALIKSSGNYAGIRASLGQSVTAQLQAIAASPWNAPSHYRSGGTFGVSIPKAGSVSTLPSVILVSAPQQGYQGPTLKDALGSDVKLTNPAQIQALAKQLHDKGIGGSTVTQGDLYAYLIDFVGKNASGIPFNFSGVPGADPSKNADKSGPNTPFPGEGISNPLQLVGDVGAFLFDAENWRYIGALVVGVPLALLGFYLLAGVRTGGEYA